MRVTVIGGTGHIGSYLVPRLVHDGHDVVSISRGKRDPYHPDGAWASVEAVAVDRERAERRGEFGGIVRDTDPDVVIDLLCYGRDSAESIVEELWDEVEQFHHCGSLWVHGPAETVPTTEDRPRSRRPLGSYGRGKVAVEEYLINEAHPQGFPATVFHPGHITGPTWQPISPLGNGDSRAFDILARGETLELPNFGQETLHHVHADDVAQAFVRAMHSFSTARGEAFNIAAPEPLTTRGYAAMIARWFGHEPSIETQEWSTWVEETFLDQRGIDTTNTHLRYSPHASIEKARSRLGFRPRYTASQAIREAVDGMIRRDIIDTELPAGPR